MMSPSSAGNDKQIALQLACKQLRYGFTKIRHIFPMGYNICTDKLPAAASVYFYKQSDLYMLVTTKAFLVAITRQSESEHSVDSQDNE